MNRKIILVSIVFFLMFFGYPENVSSSVISGFDTIRYPYFIKTEINSGILVNGFNQREALNTDITESSEERFNFDLDYYFNINKWNLSDKIQEISSFYFGIGPVKAKGTSFRSDSLTTTELNDKVFGLNVFADFDYSGRFYYDKKNYALISVNASGRFEKIKKHSEGNSEISLSEQVSEIEEEYLDNRLRYGIDAKAGWGMGNLKPVNNLMLAEYIFDKFYPDRLFSEIELKRLASVMGEVKNSRKYNVGHSLENEIDKVKSFLNTDMLLMAPESISDFWIYGEFDPRYDGKRLEAGPFFNYYNREPDYIYGGFISYESNKYIDFSRSLNYKTEFSYNRYKKRDWFLLETNLFFEYYKNLRTRISFGIKYIPVIGVTGFDDSETFQNSLIPYLEYFTQLNQTLRLNFAFQYKISDSNDFYMKGPEFSMIFFRSRY